MQAGRRRLGSRRGVKGAWYNSTTGVSFIRVTLQDLFLDINHGLS